MAMSRKYRGWASDTRRWERRRPMMAYLAEGIMWGIAIAALAIGMVALVLVVLEAL